jgi:adenine-specific DNA-methyltransferase
MVTTRKGHSDNRRAFYTESPCIVDYMVARLSSAAGGSVLEPGAGSGTLVDGVLEAYPTVSIHAIESHKETADALTHKYGQDRRIEVTAEDFLLGPQTELWRRAGRRFDGIIANPPYGAWQTKERRQALRQAYPGSYVKETYSLFIERSLDLLEVGGVMVFIVPSTFLFLHRHKALRRRLLEETKIRTVVLLPSRAFPGISFGYAELCIIDMEKIDRTADSRRNVMSVLTGLQSAAGLASLDRQPHRYFVVSQREVLSNPDHALFLATDERIAQLLNRPEQRVGEVAACVTGFYSGNDRRWIKSTHNEGRAGRYETIDPRVIAEPGGLAEEAVREGVEGLKTFVPIMKGGSRKYWTRSQWFVDWSKPAVAYYRKDSRARFQNAHYYFREGIGVPMVTSSEVVARIIEPGVFDQSIVGVFPYRSQDFWVMLGYFNSGVATKLLKIINPTANNSANYLKKLPWIPLPRPDQDLVVSAVQEIVRQLKAGSEPRPDLYSIVDTVFERVYLRM